MHFIFIISLLPFIDMYSVLSDATLLGLPFAWNNFRYWVRQARKGRQATVDVSNTNKYNKSNSNLLCAEWKPCIYLLLLLLLVPFIKSVLNEIHKEMRQSEKKNLKWKKKYHCVKPMWLIILLNLNLDWKSECVSQKSEKKPKRKRIRNDNGNISQRSFPLFIQFLPELAQ